MLKEKKGNLFFQKERMKRILAVGGDVGNATHRALAFAQEKHFRSLWYPYNNRHRNGTLVFSAHLPSCLPNYHTIYNKLRIIHQSAISLDASQTSYAHSSARLSLVALAIKVKPFNVEWDTKRNWISFKLEEKIRDRKRRRLWKCYTAYL